MNTGSQSKIKYLNPTITVAYCLPDQKFVVTIELAKFKKEEFPKISLTFEASTVPAATSTNFVEGGGTMEGIDVFTISHAFGSDSHCRHRARKAGRTNGPSRGALRSSGASWDMHPVGKFEQLVSCVFCLLQGEATSKDDT